MLCVNGSDIAYSCMKVQDALKSQCRVTNYTEYKSIATDGAHPFSGKAQQDYCDKEKRLFSIVIPGDE